MTDEILGPEQVADARGAIASALNALRIEENRQGAERTRHRPCRTQGSATPLVSRHPQTRGRQ